MTTTFLPSGLRRLVDDLIRAVRIGVRRFQRGGDRANAPAGENVSLLRWLALVLRFALVILAVHLPPLAPLKARAARMRGRASLRKPALRLFARWRIVDADAPAAPQPAAFARAVRDPVLTVQRKRDALLRALANLPALAKHVARRLPRTLLVIGWRPPKRPPPRNRRDFWDELLDGWREARFALSDWRRRTRDNALQASGP